jgi:hypothetical protein
MNAAELQLFRKWLAEPHVLHFGLPTDSLFKTPFTFDKSLHTSIEHGHDNSFFLTK